MNPNSHYTEFWTRLAVMLVNIRAGKDVKEEVDSFYEWCFNQQKENDNGDRT